MSAPPGSPPPEKLLKRAEEVLGELEKGPWLSHVKELRKRRHPLHIYGVGLVARKSPWGPGIPPGGCYGRRWCLHCTPSTASKGGPKGPGP